MGYREVVGDNTNNGGKISVHGSTALP